MVLRMVPWGGYWGLLAQGQVQDRAPAWEAA